MSFIVVIGCAVGISCSMNPEYRSSIYHPTRQVCMQQAREGLPFYFMNKQYSVRCERVCQPDAGECA